MKKLILTAAFVLTSLSAQAGTSFSFNIGGHDIHVRVPGNCRDLSCIAISAPGFGGFNSNEGNESAASAPSAKAAAPSTPAAAPVTAAPIKPATPASTESPAPALAAPRAPAASVESIATATTASPATAVALTTPSSSPAQSPEIPAPAAIQAATTPVGVWMTEKNEGKVRIEQCGVNLCGYAVNTRTGANGERVLIDMKPRDNKWTGRIHDTRGSGGGTYDSTIAMKGNNRLSVRGCAFGDMFCGGQTWTRLP